MGGRKGAVEGMVVESAFWKGKKVFVTGHTGFKGSWLCLWLQSLGATITGFSLRSPTEPSLFEIAQVVDRMQSLHGDIRDFRELHAAMAEQKPEIVIHMAAQALVRESYEDPAQTYSTNVMGTVNVFEAVRHTTSVKVVINVTSDKCYENREWVWGYRENDAMGGYDPYSSSKGCAELVTSAYRDSYFNPPDFKSHGVAIASVRAGNVIGGGDWAKDRLIPDMVRAFGKGEPVCVRCPQAVRPWQHVLEPLNGYLILAQKLWSEGPTYAEAWNFGPDDADARPVAWIVQRMTELWGQKARWIPDGGAHPHEAHYLKLDCSKASARLGWRPRYRIEEALKETVAWYQAYQAGQNMHRFTLSQIAVHSGHSLA